MIGWQVNDDGDEQTRTNIHALSGIQTHGLSIQAIKAYASDRAAIGTGRAQYHRRQPSLLKCRRSELLKKGLNVGYNRTIRDHM
jgi:hypothetical protein